MKHSRKPKIVLYFEHTMSKSGCAQTETESYQLQCQDKCVEVALPENIQGSEEKEDISRLDGYNRIKFSNFESETMQYSFNALCSDAETRCKARWEQIVRTVLQVHESTGWLRLLGLPVNIVAVYNTLENERGRKFDDKTRKLYYTAFFKKASGFAMINGLQLEQLVHEVIDVDNIDLQHMMDSLEVNNGLFDFRCFASLICTILHTKELNAQNSVRITCWMYWYQQLIPIRPDTNLKQIWDVAILCLLLYSSFQVPYSLAFGDSSESPDQLSLAYLLDIVMDVVFMVDVAMCFVTAFYDAKGVLIKDLSIISYKYATSWFLPDLGGSFPFDTVIGLFLAQTGNVGAMRILKLVRLLKLIRAAKVFHAMGELGQREGFAWLRGVIGVTRSLFLILFVAHTLGCIFYAAFVFDTGVNWMYSYQADLRHANDWERYSTSLYWAIISITTMGYGDIVPVTGPERVYCIIVALIGAIVFSYCMGTVTNLVMSQTGVAQAIAEKLQQATEYLLFRDFPIPMRHQFKSYYSHVWRKSGALYNEQEILAELSAPLRKAALIEIGAKAKAQLPILEGLDDEPVGYIFTRLSRVDFLDGDLIYKRGERASVMYFIVNGTVSLHLGGKVHSSSLVSAEGDLPKDLRRPDATRLVEDGGVFGELALFPEVASPIRSDTAVAKSLLVTYVLSAAEIPALTEQYPHVASRLREYCALRAAEDRALGHSCSLSDTVAPWASQAGGMARVCKLKSSITQMQRKLLVIKEDKLLAAASMAHGSKVLKLFMVSRRDGGNRGDETDLTSLSCVLSDGGELLCLEHSTEGLTRDAPKSLGFVRAGLSTYKLMSSEEVRRHVGRGAGGGAQLFGCSLVLLDSNDDSLCKTDSQCISSSICEVALFSWVEEELDSLVESLDGMLRSESLANESRMESAFLADQFPLSCKEASPAIISQTPLSKDWSCQYGGLSHSALSGSTWCHNLGIDLDVGYSAQSCFDLRAFSFKGVKSRAFSSIEYPLEHAEWMVQQLEDMSIRVDPCRLRHVLLKVLDVHTLLLRSMLDEMISSAQVGKDDNNRADAGGRVDSRSSKPMENITDPHQPSSKSSSEAPEELPMARTDQSNSSGSSRRQCIAGFAFGSSHDLEGDSDICRGDEFSQSFLCAGAESTSRSMNVEASLQVETNQMAALLGRWEKLAKGLMETDGLGGWRFLQRSLLRLPDEATKIYSDLQASHNVNWTDAEKKLYYMAFFKKASGFSMIDTSQMEQLVNEFADAGDMNIEQMMDSLEVNNGLYDFRSFATLLCSIMRAKQIRIEAEGAVRESCWMYWHRRLIPVRPDSILKQTWDFIILSLLLYSSFEVPYSLAFNSSDDSLDQRTSAFIFDVLLDVIFTTDVGICFVTGYYDAQGTLVGDLKIIARRYLSTWFLPDFGGSFPFDLIISVCVSQSNNIVAMRILKLVRLLKLLRAIRVFRVLNELGEKEGLGALKKAIGILRSMFLLVFVAHVMGCCFAMMIPLSQSDNWMYSYQSQLRYADSWTQYEVSVYWAIISITTIGYGDVKPVGQNERIFCIFVAMIGAITFSYCMGTISSLVANVSGAQYRLSNKNQEIIEYTNFRDISNALKFKIKAFYSLNWNKTGALYNEQEILAELSAPLRKATLIEIGAKAKAQLPILEGLDDEPVGYIFTRLSRVDFLDGDLIYKRGERASVMYFIVNGTVSLHLGGKVHSSSLVSAEGDLPKDLRRPDATRLVEDGGVFGELALFPEVASPIRSDTAVAKSLLVTYVLSAAEIPALTEQYPHVASRLREYCALRAAEDRALGHSCSLSDTVAPWASQAGGMARVCKLKSSITQMQRKLLVIKEDKLLAAASMAHGSKVLKLFMVSRRDGGNRGDETDLTSLSCVLSDGGELLCLEHSTEGLTRDAPKSLGFVRAGLSTYKLMSSEEVRRHVGRGAGGGAQLFGCSLVLLDSNDDSLCKTDSQCISSSICEVALFSWVEEELDSLVEGLDGLLHCKE